MRSIFTASTMKRVMGTTVLLCTACVFTCLGQDGPKILSSKNFVLTPEQAAAGIDGRIKLSLEVDKQGIVKEADVIAGPIWPCRKTPKKELGEFKRGVIESARAFRFAPYVSQANTVLVLTIAVGEAYTKSVTMNEAEKLA